MGAEQHVEAPGRRHRERADGGVLGDGVVGHDHDGQRGADRQCRATAQRGGDAEPGGAEAGRDAEGRSGLTRPDGIGRSGRSSASTSRSHQSLKAMPDQ